MTNSVDPDQMASEEAIWSGSTLFAKVGVVMNSRIRVKETGYTECFALVFEKGENICDFLFAALKGKN